MLGSGNQEQFVGNKERKQERAEGIAAGAGPVVRGGVPVVDGSPGLG